MADMTIILPHKRNPLNNDALQVCVDMLVRNTVNDFELLISAAVNRPLFPAIDRLFRQAQTDCLVFWNSDMFAAPGWDVAMLALFDYGAIVTNILVEPGAISMDGNNHHHDFGRRVETFRRAEFEAWSQSPEAPGTGNNEGWYAPYMISQKRYLDIGGFDFDPADVRAEDGFNNRPLDIDLFLKHKAQGGVVRRAKCYTYHLQRWSDPAEQTKGNR